MSRARSGAGARGGGGAPGRTRAGTDARVEVHGAGRGAADDGAGFGVPSGLGSFSGSGSTTASGAVPTAALRRGTSESRKGIGVGAFVLAIITAGALAHVAVRIKSLEVGYALGRERKVATELEEQRRRLQIEIGMLKDPGRVVLIARDKLKMGPPAPDAIVALAAAGALTNGAPPVPLAGPGKSKAAKAAKGGGR